MQFDSIDRALLEALQKDARVSNRHLARQVGVAESTCLARVAALERRGAITGYGAKLALGAVNRGVQALLHIKIRPQALASARAFCDEVTALPEVLEVMLVTGAADLVVHVAVGSAEQLRDFVLELAQNEAIADVRSSIIYLAQRADTVVVPPDHVEPGDARR